MRQAEGSSSWLDSKVVAVFTGLVESGPECVRCARIDDRSGLAIKMTECESGPECVQFAR